MLLFQDSQNGLSGTSVQVSEGMIAYSFTRAKVTTLELPAGLGTTVIDLANPFHIQLATGPLDHTGQSLAHHHDRAVSESAVVLH